MNGWPNLLWSALFIALAIGMPSRSHAAEAVDLELALAVDVSGSIDDVEASLQRNGYIAAFRHPQVIGAISGGILRRIAVAYYEWAGYGHMKLIADWTVIGNAASANAFADRLTKIPPQTANRTAISSAINFAVPFFALNGFQGTRRVLDISGDGPNNWGPSLKAARDMAIAAGITINGLPIVNDRPSPFGWRQMPNLDLYYRNCVIGGPGAFIVVAQDFKDFARAIRRKLVLEIAGVRPVKKRVLHRATLLAQQKDTPRVAPPCNIGEQRWRRRTDY